MQLVEKIIQNELCTGCGICASISDNKIQMGLSAQGYLRPVIHQPLSSIQESIIQDVCPGITLKHESLDATYHPIWGPLIQVRTGYAVNPEVRFAGSSGGALSALLIYLLENRLVDYVLHIGVANDDPLLNEIKVSRNHAEVVSNAGSRYAPSAPLVNIDEYLKGEGKFAFVGKPCDVAALRQYGRKNPAVSQKIPYMLAFMCAGVPSIEGTYAILNRFNTKKEDVRSFVYRGNGWPGMTRVEKHDGTSHEVDYGTSWGSILNRYLQPRCKICPDGIGEFADVVCADAWYGKDGYPDFSEQDGRSLIISRTKVGDDLVNTSCDTNYLCTASLPIADISQMQPYQEMRKKMVLSRLLALKIFSRVTPEYVNLGLYKAALMGGIIANMRNFIGMAKRLVLRK